MTAEELLDARNEQPFQPFRIVMANGGTYDVRSQDSIMVGRQATIVGLSTWGHDKSIPDRLIQVPNGEVRRIIPLATIIGA